MSTIDAQGNLHDTAGRFDGKENSRPTGLAVGATGAVELGDICCGQTGIDFVTSIAAVGGHGRIVTTDETRETAYELVRGIGDVSGKKVTISHTPSANELLLGPGGQIGGGLLARSDGGVLAIFDAEADASAMDALEMVMRERSRSDVQIVLVSSSCPCGRAGTACTCTSIDRRRHRDKTGIRFRDQYAATVDLEREMVAAKDARTGTGYLPPRPTGVDNAVVANGVQAVRSRQTDLVELTGSTSWDTIPQTWLYGEGRLSDSSGERLERAVARGEMSHRHHARVVRSAWLLAAADVADQPSLEHVSRALELNPTSA